MKNIQVFAHAGCWLAWLAFSGLWRPAVVRAQDRDDGRAQAQEARAAAAPFGAVGQVERPITATQDVDPTASGTSVTLGGRNRPLEPTSEALLAVPGLRVPRRGGPSTPALVSLRGAEVGHTVVLLDAIPLNTPDSGAFDLSLLPLSAFERVEVFRGGAPIWHSQGAIGGVVRFVPATPQTSSLEASVGAASFGQREGMASVGLVSPSGKTTLFGHLRALSSDNDYEYESRNGLLLVSGEKRELPLLNAQQLLGDGLLYGTTELAGGRLSVLLAGHGRLEGVPGPQALPAYQTRRKLVRGLAGLSYEREGRRSDGTPWYRVQFGLSAGIQRNSFTDIETEIARTEPVASNDLWTSGQLRVAGSYAVLPYLEVNAVGALNYDAYAPQNPLAFTRPPRSSQRHGQMLTLEPRLHGRLFGLRMELRPSVRWQWSQTAIRATENALEPVVANRDALVSTYRVGAVVEPAVGFALAASAANGVRLPSISELFGDRGFQEPNPQLLPERAATYDVGLTVSGRAGPLLGTLELRGFLLRIEDLIRFKRTAQFTVRPENEATAEIFGGELGLSAKLGPHLELTASATALRTRDAKGNPLTLRPPLMALVRPQVRFDVAPDWELRAFVEAWHLSHFYYATRPFEPGRTLFATGVGLSFARRVSLDAQVRNLFDAETVDVLSRPLPGRTLRLSLTLRQGL